MHPDLAHLFKEEFDFSLEGRAKYENGKVQDLAGLVRPGPCTGSWRVNQRFDVPDCGLTASSESLAIDRHRWWRCLGRSHARHNSLRHGGPWRLG